MDDRGFSLVEVLVACGLTIVTLAVLAHAIVFASALVTGAAATTKATLLASQRMEQLRSLTFGSDALNRSPPGTLAADTAGYVDYVDESGTSLGSLDASRSSSAAFVRRWSIEPLQPNPSECFVLVV